MEKKKIEESFLEKLISRSLSTIIFLSVGFTFLLGYSTNEFRGKIKEYNVFLNDNKIEISDENSFRLIETSPISETYRYRINGKKDLGYIKILGFELENSINEDELDDLKKFCNNMRDEVYKYKGIRD